MSVEHDDGPVASEAPEAPELLQLQEGAVGSGSPSATPASLPSSPTAASADATIELPFAEPSCALAIQAKRALLIRNALVAANVAACPVAAVVATVQENVRDGGKQVEKDEYMEMLRQLPDVRAGEAFHALEGPLGRIFRLFQAAERLDLLGIGTLVLARGSVRETFEAAVQIAATEGSTNDAPQTDFPSATVERAFVCLLLAVAALFDEEGATDEQLKASAGIISASAAGSMERLRTYLNVVGDERGISLSELARWIDERAGKVLPWAKLVDQTKWPTTKRLATSNTPQSPRSPVGSPKSIQSPKKSEEQPPLSEAPTTGYSDEDEGPPALSFRFSGADGGILTIGEAEADTLFDLLRTSAFTKVFSQTMYDTFVQHTGDGLLEEETFLEAIEELVTMTNEAHLMQDNEFLDSMLDIFRCFLPENCMRVDAFEIAAGFSLFAWGSKSDKLASSFHYFDADSKGFLNRQQLWRFLRSVLIILLYLSPPSESILARYGSLADLVDTGEQEIMENIMDDFEQDPENESSARSRSNSELRLGVFTFEDFGEWYNAGGCKGMSWLELLDLRKWIYFSASFQIDALDVEPVDPVVASTNYFTAQNIQVDVESGNEDSYQRFGFEDAILEEDDEDEQRDSGGNNARLSHSTYSSATTGPSHQGSVNSTMPAICLRNEIILEFDLAIDTDDDSAVELPLSTLSFDNGDLIQYFELQRVIRLHEVELSRMYEVFEPYMESSSSAWMEKSTFDKCMMELLPPDVATGVAAAFSIHPNTPVPPPSIGRAKDSKMVADVLSRLFFAFNRGGTGKIDLVEFVSAFTLFCAGSKSEKLACAYQLFDMDRDGALTRREMWKYLRSFLTMLLALGNGAELSAEAIASVADATAIAIADAIFKDTNKTFSVRQVPSQVRQSNRYSLDTPESADTVVATRNVNNRRGQYYHRGSLPNVDDLSVEGAGASTAGPGAGSAFMRGGIVSFGEFAKWYSTNGFSIIAWIELLDTKKWPQVDEEIAGAILRYISHQRHALTAAAARGSDSGPSSGSTTGSGRNRSSSLEGEVASDELTPLNTERLLTSDGVRNINTAAPSAMPTARGINDLLSSPSSHSSSRSLASVALQFKLTSYDSTTLRIRLKDVAIVYTISERMNMSGMGCEELLNNFHKHGTGRSLTKVGFLRTMRDLVPRESLSNEDQEFLSFHLLRMFALFEAESVLDEGDEDSESSAASPVEREREIKKTSSVEKLQILAGMSIFCGGSKSSKLGVLFKLFDTHGDGYVSRRHLFELLKSVLVVLFAFSSYNTNKAHTNDTNVNTWSINSAAERAAGAVISKLFCEATCRHPDAITLSEFAAWYANGGYMDCPWLELLDLSKWPAKEAFEASKREKPLIYAFDTLDEGSILDFSESDMSTYLFMLRSTKLSELSVTRIYDALLAYATPSAEEILKISRAEQGKNSGQSYSYAGVEEDEGAYLVLTRGNFYECIRSLVSKEDMSEKAQQTSSKLLSRIFNAFDRKRCGRVNALELACGMSILGKGSKSQKLALAFEFITKMRQQRNRTLNNYASANVAGFIGGGGFGGVNSISTGGAFGWASTRGAVSTTTGLRRSMLQNEANALPHTVLFIYLRSFLLALMALSDGAYRLGLEKMYAEADDYIEEAMGDLMTEVAANGNNVVGGYAGYGTARFRARVTFEQFAEWYNSGGGRLIPWIILLDVARWEIPDQSATANVATARTFRSTRVVSQRHPDSSELIEPVRTSPKRPGTQKKQIRQSEIVSSSYPHGVQTQREDPTKQPLSTHRESIGAMSLSSDGPIMVFAVHEEAAELQFFHEDVARLKQFIRQTHMYDETPWEFVASMKAAFGVENNLTIEVFPKKFIDAFKNARKNIASLTDEDLGEEVEDLLQSVLNVFTKIPTSTATDHFMANGDEDEDEYPNQPIDFAEALSGILVVCDGMLLEKFKCSATLFDHDMAEHADETTMETLRMCLVSFLMAFYGMSSSLSSEIVRDCAYRGADDVLRAFSGLQQSEDEFSPTKRRTKREQPPLDISKVISIKEFCEWFGETGYHSHPWVELVDLQHWPAAINIRSLTSGPVA